MERPSPKDTPRDERGLEGGWRKRCVDGGRCFSGELYFGGDSASHN